MGIQVNDGKRPPRAAQILQALAQELADRPGARITTAALAGAVGVSEAALYRHFPSKARIFEGLIDFAEDSVFSLLNRIMEQEQDAARRCEKTMKLLLGFAERNPGISRILLGDALIGENERLRARAAGFFARIETQLKQVLREANLTSTKRPAIPIAAAANQIMALIEGRMNQYVRSNFAYKPTAHISEQWAALEVGLFRDV